jgi:hypothetical protein
MNYYHSHDLGDNINTFEQIIQKIKETKKYKHLIIVNDNKEYTTAIINLGENEPQEKLKKSDFTFHLSPAKKVKVGSEFINTECSICFQKFRNNNYYRKLDGCNHIFHKKCIDEWFFQSKSYSCPLCRKNPYSLQR